MEHNPVSVCILYNYNEEIRCFIHSSVTATLRAERGHAHVVMEGEQLLSFDLHKTKVQLWNKARWKGYWSDTDVNPTDV